MILSHKHRFIFIKTKKTAGTSLEIALSKFCGPLDVITPIGAQDEVTRRALGYPGPQNYVVPLTDYRFHHWRRVLRGKERPAFYNHIGASEIRQYVAPEIWNDYYKFCVDRDPWDKAVSLYYWRHKTEPRPTLSAFVQSDAVLAVAEGGYELYSIDGRVVVDRVCRYERLAEELEALTERLGLPEALTLPAAKASTRTDRRNYRELLSEQDRQRIAELCGSQIEYMQYPMD